MLAFGVWDGDISSHAVIEGTVEAICRDLLDKYKVLQNMQLIRYIEVC